MSIPVQRSNLDTQTVAALRAVDLRLYGGTQHGELVEVEPYGPACVGLVDGDYQGVQNIVDDLSPKRGHVLALEAAFFRPEYNDNNWFRTYMDGRAEKSILVHAKPSDMTAFAAEARETQTIDTHQYAKCLAIAKGLRTELADASLADALEWKAQRQHNGISERPSQDEEAAFRNLKIVERLGATALTMQRRNRLWHRPILAMLVGDRHVNEIASLLQPYDLVPRTETYSPNLYERHLAAIDYIKEHGEDPGVPAWIERTQAVTLHRSTGQ